MNQPRAPKKKFFISYSRHATEDGELAEFLESGLEQAGHEVFIDTGIGLGDDWGEEIAKQLARCDYLVVLLSRESAHSEMVLGEVRRAHRRRRRDGGIQILPIRVRYEGELDYELDSYLARTQYALWARSADNDGVLQQILEAAATQGAAAPIGQPAASQTKPTKKDYRRPSPGVGIPPGGALRQTDPFYVDRPVDALIENVAALPGNTICIRAPRQMGKSSLLIRYLRECHQAGKRFVFLDFQGFTDAEVGDYPTLLGSLARLLLQRLELQTDTIPAFTATTDFTAFVEDAVIKKIDRPLTLAFDEVDRVLGRSYQGDFFTMLRYWHNRRAEPFSVWEDVDLALVIATEPHLLIDSKDRSPFNVATPIEPKPFDRSALDDLSRHYGAPLTAAELEDLHELVGGHPYLTRLAFYRLASGQSASFDELYEQAAAHEGPFGDHLRAMLMLIGEQQGLLAAMEQAIVNGSVKDDETYYRLHGAGLANRDDRRRVIPANTLYARFFRPRQ